MHMHVEYAHAQTNRQKKRHEMKKNPDEMRFTSLILSIPRASDGFSDGFCLNIAQDVQ
jgi:hypothetical protein